MPGWGHPPAWLVRVSACVLVAATVVAVVGAVRIGVTVDETFHVVRLDNYLDRGWYLLDDDFGASGPGSWVEDVYVYAPVTTLLLHLLNVVAGNDQWGNVSASADAYVVRHLGVVLIGALGVAATAVITRLLSESWRWAVVACAVLMALPMWTGHMMFNVKDTPVATGYTFVTLGCMLLLRPAARPGRGRVVALAVLTAGLVLAVGTRPAIWPGLAAAIGLAGVGVLVLQRGAARRWSAGVVALALVAAGTTLALVYPAMFLHPGSWLVGSASESAGYHGPRFRGYIPLTILCTVPVLLLMLGVVGSVVRLLTRLRRVREGMSVHDVLMALVVAQALLLPVLIAIRTPSLNGGLRHVLFAAPAVAVLVAAGVAQVLADAGGRMATRVWTVVAAVALVVPTATQVQLFPLGYAYSNPLADAAGLDLAGDFWQASFRDYADVVPPGAFVVCGAKLDDEARPLRQTPNGGQSWLQVSQDCATTDDLSVLQPFLPDAPRDTAVAPTFVALVVYDDPAPQGCEEIGRVVRHRLVTEDVVSRALMCPLVLPDHVGPVVLDGEGRGASYLLGGWSGNGGASTVTVDDRASLGAHLAPSTGPVTVRLSGDASGDVRFLVNNEPARARATSTGWDVTSDGTPDELGEPGNVVLTVVVDGGEAHVSGFDVVAGGAG